MRPSFVRLSAGCMVSALVSVGSSLTSGAIAQQAPGPSPARPVGQAKTAAVKPTPAPKPDASPTGNDSALRQRIEQLEEQLTEMQVTVGTLDSLAKGGASSSSSVYRGNTVDGGGNADAGRMSALETQVRALATQVDQLSQSLRQANARPASAASSVIAAPAVMPNTSAASTSADPIARLMNNGRLEGPSALPNEPAASATLPGTSANDSSSKQIYETAYGYLLQQDFASAEVAFDDFVRRYPADPLAGNAQYWLGETYFARGQYKPAAASFLKGYQTYQRNSKAPDSVLKLAMSLDKLGQKDAACASYGELAAKFPNAPGHVKTRADTERRRLGCS